MSKFLPDPQIQSLRAMRAGDIAFANGGTVSIGKQHIAFPQPTALESIAMPAAVPALETVAGMPSEAPVIGNAFATTLSQDALESIALPAAVEALETLAGMPTEAPVIGVATGTSVI
jgi:hypothetical protein